MHIPLSAVQCGTTCLQMSGRRLNIQNIQKIPVPFTGFHFWSFFKKNVIGIYRDYSNMCVFFCVEFPFLEHPFYTQSTFGVQKVSNGKQLDSFVLVVQINLCSVVLELYWSDEGHNGITLRTKKYMKKLLKITEMGAWRWKDLNYTSVFFPTKYHTVCNMNIMFIIV